MSLRPDETIQKVLISSTCAFVGEYEAENFLVTHAWPNFSDQAMFSRRFEGPNSRSAYLVSFRTPPLIREPGVPIPNYSSIGESLAANFSLLYGKKFDSHGGVETTGSFHIPNLASFALTSSPELPQNRHKPRANYAISLRLEEIERIKFLIFRDKKDVSFYHTFDTANKFYHRALQMAEHDYEIAYLNLITSGEILANAFNYNKNDLLDQQIIGVLAQIEGEISNGPSISRLIKSRLYQVKKRFVRTICELIQDDFFENYEVQEKWQTFERANFERAIAAAYDLRSK